MSQIPLPARCAGLVAATLAAAMPAGRAHPPATRQEVVALVDGEPITALDIEHRTQIHADEHAKAAAAQGGARQPDRRDSGDARSQAIQHRRSRTGRGQRVRQCRQPHGRRRAEADANARQAAAPARTRSSTGCGPKWPGQRWCAGGTRRAWKFGTATSRRSCTCTSPTTRIRSATNTSCAPSFSSCRAGSPEAAFEARKHDAEALRARFLNCNEGIPFARALATSRCATRSSNSPPICRKQLRDILDKTEVGHLTPPERRRRACRCSRSAPRKRPRTTRRARRKCATKCSSRNSARKAKRYLAELRRAAMIEYK